MDVASCTVSGNLESSATEEAYRISSYRLLDITRASPDLEL